MKKLIIAMSAVSSLATAQTTYYYNANGQNAGTATRSGNTTYFYDANGQNAGTATRSGNTTYYYNANGQNAGTMTAPVAPVYTPIPMYTNPTQSLTPMYDSIFGR